MRSEIIYIPFRKADICVRCFQLKLSDFLYFAAALSLKIVCMLPDDMLTAGKLRS